LDLFDSTDRFVYKFGRRFDVNFLINRKDLIEEMRLREYIRESIKNHREKRKEKETLEEQKLREYIRSFIKEAKETTFYNSTAINLLRDLLKKVLPTIESGYKMLTTDPEQRKSYKEHILAAFEGTLGPVELSRKAPELPSEMAPVQESREIKEFPADPKMLKTKRIPEINVDMGEGGPKQEPEKDPKFVDVEKGPDKTEQDLFALDQQGDSTGQNVALKAYKGIEQAIRSTFETIGNEDDRNTFKEYLMANTKLYFDKWENELSVNLDSSTSPANPPPPKM